MCAGVYTISKKSGVVSIIREALGGGDDDQLWVGRCRLTVSKPLLTAPMVSALEAKIL